MLRLRFFPAVLVTILVIVSPLACLSLPSSTLHQNPLQLHQSYGSAQILRKHSHRNPSCEHDVVSHKVLALRGGADSMAAGAALLGANAESFKAMAANDKIFTTQRKVGFGLIAGGILFSFLGFMLFMNRSLIGSGNLMMISGTVVLAGWTRTKEFLFTWERARGTGIFLFGVYLVLRGWARLGVLVELFGILNLFANFMPALVSLLKKIPVVGPVLTPVLESPAFEKGLGMIMQLGSKTKGTRTNEYKRSLPLYH